MPTDTTGHGPTGRPDPPVPPLPAQRTKGFVLPAWSRLLPVLLVLTASVAGIGYLMSNRSPEGSGVGSPAPSSLIAEGPPPTSAWPTVNDSPTVTAGENVQYVDCAGDGPQDGSVDRPWHSFDVLNSSPAPAGTTVLLRRGCSWPGGLKIHSRSAGARVDAYGAGAAPVLTGEGVDRTSGVLDVEADGVSLAGLHLTAAAGAGLRIEGPRARVDNLEIDHVAFAVEVLAPGAVITGTWAHDLHMYINTPGGSDDTGAVGFSVQANDVTIRGSSCVNCRASSHDFGYDGGFAEIYDHGDRLLLEGNSATNVQGIMEIGGVAQDGSARGVVVEQNTFREVHGGIWVHRNDPFTIPVGSITMIGNTVVNTTSEVTLGGDVSSMVVKDNNFVVPGPVSSSGAPGVHTGNHYYLTRTGSLGYPTDPSETVAPTAAYRG
jgi:hypothetical protein